MKKAFLIATAIALFSAAVLGSVAYASDECTKEQPCEVAYCDGRKVIDYCAPVPEYEEKYEGCPFICGLHRCDFWSERGRCGKPKQPEARD